MKTPPTEGKEATSIGGGVPARRRYRARSSVRATGRGNRLRHLTRVADEADIAVATDSAPQGEVVRSVLRDHHSRGRPGGERVGDGDTGIELVHGTETRAGILRSA